MTGKQIFLLLIVATLSGTLITAAAIYVWRTQPELLSLPPNTAQTQHAPSEQELLRAKNDSLQKQIKFISDSLQNVISNANSEMQKDKQEREVRITIEANKRHEILASEAQKNSMRLKNMKAFAEMYDKAEPAEVAKILADSETDYAANVLKLMKRKTAAKVIEKLPTKKAVEVSKLIPQ